MRRSAECVSRGRPGTGSGHGSRYSSLIQTDGASAFVGPALLFLTRSYIYFKTRKIKVI